MTIDELQAAYERSAAEIDALTAALAESESAAAAARAELDEVVDGDSILRAMAEERAAKNRAALIRRNLAETRERKNRTSRELERARESAVAGLVRATMTETCQALVEVYQAVVAARDEVYQAQRATGAYPAGSPLDGVCDSLEHALRRAGAAIVPDSSGSITVRYGEFQYIRRPIGYVPPKPAPARPRRPILSAMQESLAQLNRYNRQHAHEFDEE